MSPKRRSKPTKIIATYPSIQKSVSHTRAKSVGDAVVKRNKYMNPKRTKKPPEISVTYPSEGLITKEEVSIQKSV